MDSALSKILCLVLFFLGGGVGFFLGLSQGYVEAYEEVSAKYFNTRSLIGDIEIEPHLMLTNYSKSTLYVRVSSEDKTGLPILAGHQTAIALKE